MFPVATARNNSLKEILAFTYPKLHTGACWYIGFHAFDPASCKMRRKRIKINSVGTATEKRRYATQVCHRIATKLEGGWNPWVEAEAQSSYKTFTDVMLHYRYYIEKLNEDGVLRKSTKHGYFCSAGIMERWNTTQPAKIQYIYQFDTAFCVRFLDYVYLERKASPATRNNNLAFLRSFSTFLVQHSYLKTKPTEGLQRVKKAPGKKNRSLISDHDVRRLHDWLMVHDQRFLLVCYFLHYMLIRPKEICRLRLRDISVAKQTIYIDETISKNKKSSIVTIPSKIIDSMVDLGYFDCPDSDYIFSNDFRPGSTFW